MTFQGLGEINFTLQHLREVTGCGLHGRGKRRMRGKSIQQQHRKGTKKCAFIQSDSGSSDDTAEKCHMKMEAPEKPTLPHDLSDVYSFYSQQLL